MSILGGWALMTGSAIAIAGSAMFLFADRAHESLYRFYRSLWAGRVLSTAAIVWASWVLYSGPWETPWGRCDHLKPLTFVVAPALVVVVPALLSDLLAPRALGALMLLVAAPVLDAARCHLSPWSLALVVAAYVAVVVGMVLVVSPYRMYAVVKLFRSSARACRLAGGVGFVVGLGLLCLGLFVY